MPVLPRDGGAVALHNANIIEAGAKVLGDDLGERRLQPLAVGMAGRQDRHRAARVDPQVDGVIAEDDRDAALDELAANDAVHALVITGAGNKAFVAGADIGEIAALDGQQPAAEFSRFGQSLSAFVASCCCRSCLVCSLLRCNSVLVMIELLTRAMICSTMLSAHAGTMRELTSNEVSSSFRIGIRRLHHTGSLGLRTFSIDFTSATQNPPVRRLIS